MKEVLSPISPMSWECWPICMLYDIYWWIMIEKCFFFFWSRFLVRLSVCPCVACKSQWRRSLCPSVTPYQRRTGQLGKWTLRVSRHGKTRFGAQQQHNTTSQALWVLNQHKQDSNPCDPIYHRSQTCWHLKGYRKSPKFSFREADMIYTWQFISTR